MEGVQAGLGMLYEKKNNEKEYRVNEVI